jgi:hypothetical protein
MVAFEMGIKEYWSSNRRIFPFVMGKNGKSWVEIMMVFPISDFSHKSLKMKLL